MILTNSRVKQFEQDQKDHGTKTAMYNLIWEVASNLFKEIGVKRVQTWNTLGNVKDK